MTRRPVIVWGALAALATACGPTPPPAAPDPPSPSTATQATTAPKPSVRSEVRARSRPSTVSWIAAGGGSWPQDNQVSIEADLGLAEATFGPERGILLFAGGPGADGVQVREASPRGDPLLRVLGELIDPRAGRDATFRPTRLSPHGPASYAALEGALETAFDPSVGPAPLTLYLAGHGDAAAARRDTTFVLWAGDSLTPPGLSNLVAAPAATRPVRLVLTSCHSGAFAELAFRAADAEAAVLAEPVRCGFFASTWDRPSSGCDPDPDRRRHEGYGVHFLNALAGKDRDGGRLALDLVDFDGDGKISLMDAHTRARIASTGIDVPTATSERWLRRYVTDDVPDAPVMTLPHEAAVVASLGPHLPGGIAGVEALAASQAAAFERGATELAELVDAEAIAADVAAGALFARWAPLSDPLHPDFMETLTRDRALIEAHLRTDPAYHAYEAARDAANRASAIQDGRMVEMAPVLRVLRAKETQRLAGRLRALGGVAWDGFVALGDCESGEAP